MSSITIADHLGRTVSYQESETTAAAFPRDHSGGILLRHPSDTIRDHTPPAFNDSFCSMFLLVNRPAFPGRFFL